MISLVVWWAIVLPLSQLQAFNIIMCLVQNPITPCRNSLFLTGKKTEHPDLPVQGFKVSATLITFQPLLRPVLLEQEMF